MLKERASELASVWGCCDRQLDHFCPLSDFKLEKRTALLLQRDDLFELWRRRSGVEKVQRTSFLTLREQVLASQFRDSIQSRLQVVGPEGAGDGLRGVHEFSFEVGAEEQPQPLPAGTGKAAAVPEGAAHAVAACRFRCHQRPPPTRAAAVSPSPMAAASLPTLRQSQSMLASPATDRPLNSGIPRGMVQQAAQAPTTPRVANAGFFIRGPLAMPGSVRYTDSRTSSNLRCKDYS